MKILLYLYFLIPSRHSPSTSLPAGEEFTTDLGTRPQSCIDDSFTISLLSQSFRKGDFRLVLKFLFLPTPVLSLP